MGCTPSSLLESATSNKTDELANIANDPEALALLAPPPKIPLQIGTGVKKMMENNQNVIFVFGGPGSMKGLILEELVSEFNFIAITTEEIVLNYLPNKVANTVETTQEIQELLKTDTALLTLEWVLHLMGAKLSTSTHQRFIIDIIPNLLSILKVDSFNKESYHTELSSFERRHPILFALNLVVTDDEILNSTPGILAQRNQDDEEKEKEKEKEKTEKEKKDKQKNNSGFGTGADEADSSRMRRRNDVYMQKAEPFLAYFRETTRIAKIELVTRKQEYVQNKMKDFFKERGFANAKDRIQVVLFVFDETKIEGLDPMWYKILKVRLSSIISNRQDSMDDMIRGVKRYIRRSASSSQNHLVVLDCLNLNSDVTYKKLLNFLEVRECFLDNYIAIKSTTVEGRPFKKPFKVVTVTSTGVVCLFSADVQSELCKKIAICFSENPDNPTSKKNNSPSTEDSQASRSASRGSTIPPSPNSDANNTLMESLAKTNDHLGASISTVTTGATANSADSATHNNKNR